MRGAVVGPQPIAELEALVRAKFGAVPNTDLQVPTFPGAQASSPVALHQPLLYSWKGRPLKRMQGLVLV